LEHPKCVALGEIGLDYHFPDNPDRAFQQEMFRKQLEIAAEKKMPVVIHSRDALLDTLATLRTFEGKLVGGLMHCYSYSAESARDFLKLGLYFSFGGTSTFKNAKKVHESVRQIPATRILSETDCPYLSPEPFRGVFPNESGRVRYVVENLARLRGESLEELQENIIENAKRLFPKLKIN
jgi:TatD DNase family protein